MKAEHKLFYEITENTKTSTEKVLTPTTENELPEIIDIKSRNISYRINVPFCDPKFGLRFAKDDNGIWIIMGFSLTKCIGYANLLFETSPEYLALAAIQICRAPVIVLRTKNKC